MAIGELDFLIPGDLATRTGGYAYDRKIAMALSMRGWSVKATSLPGDYPTPSDTARSQARQILGRIADRGTVLIDGLAFGVLADELAPHRDRLRLIALVHHPLALETGLPSATARTLAASERQALTQASAIITTCEATARTLDSYGVAAERVTVIRPGCERVDINRSEPRDHRKLLCVATLTPRKGHDVLFEALAGLTEHAWQLRCVGSLRRDESWLSHLCDRLSAWRLGNHVNLLGELSDTDLEHEFSEAGLFVLTSRYEGYGLVFDEALAHGLPVVATRVGDIDNILPADARVTTRVDDVAQIRNALQRWFVDTEFRSGLVAAARSARPPQRTWDCAAQELATLLLSTARSASACRP